MQCVDYAKGPSTSCLSGQKANKRLFEAKLTASNIEPLGALFADSGKGLCK
jgi:hypothetical protein